MFWSRINFPDTIFTDLKENTLPTEGLQFALAKILWLVTTGKEKMYKDVFIMAGVFAVLLSGI